MSYQELVDSVTVKDCDKAFEVWKHCRDLGASGETAMGCIWRAARREAKPCKSTRKQRRRERNDDLGPIEFKEDNVNG